MIIACKFFIFDISHIKLRSLNGKCAYLLSYGKIFSQSMSSKFTEKEKIMRSNYDKLEQKFLDNLKLDNLTKEDLIVHEARQNAIHKRLFTYDDPETGLKVLTRYRHFLKGSCCGNACRHCIYDHERVAADIKANRHFNGAFWVNKEIPSNESLKNVVQTTLVQTTTKQFNSMELQEDKELEKEDSLLYKH